MSRTATLCCEFGFPLVMSQHTSGQLQTETLRGNSGDVQAHPSWIAMNPAAGILCVHLPRVGKGRAEHPSSTAVNQPPWSELKCCFTSELG